MQRNGCCDVPVYRCTSALRNGNFCNGRKRAAKVRAAVIVPREWLNARGTVHVAAALRCAIRGIDQPIFAVRPGESTVVRWPKYTVPLLEDRRRFFDPRIGIHRVSAS